MVERAGAGPTRLLLELAKYDEAVAVQAASLCHADGRDVRGLEFEEALKKALPHVRRAFAAYAATLPR